jgi:hypothetical protein
MNISPVADIIPTRRTQLMPATPFKFMGSTPIGGPGLRIGAQQQPPPRQPVPGRNGQIKATGFPRGMFRPT